MLKWQRNYKAKFEIGHRDKNNDFIPEETLEIAYPFTCQMDIDLGTNKASNTAVFQFINLSRNDQTRLWLDIFNAGKKYVYMEFYAGYDKNMPFVFAGMLHECTSEKPSGSTEWVTQMSAFDGGMLYQYGFMNVTYSKGTKLSDIIDLATKGLKNAELGYITPEILTLSSDRTFIGQTMDILGREYGGYQIFVNKGEINILGDNDVIPGQVLVLTDETGLLGSPKRAGTYVVCDMIFEPQLHAGQAISLLSDSLPWENQTYQIVNVRHKGVISPRICDKLITTVTLSTLIKEPNILEKATPTRFTGAATTGIWNKPVKGYITSKFGPRAQPIKGASSFHRGIDIGAAYNTPVIAPANGKVQIAQGLDGKGYGRFVTIDNGIINGKRVTSWYGHLNKSVVANGQDVFKGQTVIGYVGSTGNSTGPHLHFGIQEDKTFVNPINYVGKY